MRYKVANLGQPEDLFKQAAQATAQAATQAVNDAWVAELKQNIDRAAAEMKVAQDELDRLESGGAGVEQLREAGGKLNDAQNRYNWLRGVLERGIPGPRKLPPTPVPNRPLIPPAPPPPEAAAPVATGPASCDTSKGQFPDGYGGCRGSIGLVPAGIPGGGETASAGALPGLTLGRRLKVVNLF